MSLIGQEASSRACSRTTSAEAEAAVAAPAPAAPAAAAEIIILPGCASYVFRGGFDDGLDTELRISPDKQQQAHLEEIAALFEDVGKEEAALRQQRHDAQSQEMLRCFARRRRLADRVLKLEMLVLPHTTAYVHTLDLGHCNIHNEGVMALAKALRVLGDSRQLLGIGGGAKRSDRQEKEEGRRGGGVNNEDRK